MKAKYLLFLVFCAGFSEMSFATLCDRSSLAKVLDVLNGARISSHDSAKIFFLEQEINRLDGALKALETPLSEYLVRMAGVVEEAKKRGEKPAPLSAEILEEIERIRTLRYIAELFGSAHLFLQNAVVFQNSTGSVSKNSETFGTAVRFLEDNLKNISRTLHNYKKLRARYSSDLFDMSLKEAVVTHLRTRAEQNLELKTLVQDLMDESFSHLRGFHLSLLKFKGLEKIPLRDWDRDSLVLSYLMFDLRSKTQFPRLDFVTKDILKDGVRSMFDVELVEQIRFLKSGVNGFLQRNLTTMKVVHSDNGVNKDIAIQAQSALRDLNLFFAIIKKKIETVNLSDANRSTRTYVAIVLENIELFRLKSEALEVLFERDAFQVFGGEIIPKPELSSELARALSVFETKFDADVKEHIRHRSFVLPAIILGSAITTTSLGVYFYEDLKDFFSKLLSVKGE
jgi:hypothetical protein